MEHKQILLYLAFIIILFSCSTSKRITSADNKANILDSVLKANPQYFDTILRRKDSFRLQIIYTKIDRDKKNVPHFTDYYFNVSDSLYFYPASTVKMPAALLSLEKINRSNSGINQSTLLHLDSSGLQEINKKAFLAEDNTKASIATFIKRIFLVSDNDAYNHLYEFLGQEDINTSLREKGYTDVQIRHRLQISLTEEQNRFTNAINFYDSAGRILYHQPVQYSNFLFEKRNDLLGKGYMKDTEIIYQPFNFSAKNKISLPDLHNILRSVIFPQSINKQKHFDLTPDDYHFLYRYMSAYPRESNFTEYRDITQYYDAYGKFLLYGSQRGDLPSNIRIFSKEGDAYGFLTDVAYIVDFENKIEFMLSATIYCNSDGIFNDDKYDYDTVGYLFMKNLGKALYDYELNRVRKFVPDLSSFKIDYSKE